MLEEENILVFQQKVIDATDPAVALYPSCWCSILFKLVTAWMFQMTWKPKL